MVVHTVRTVFAPVMYLVCHVCAVTTSFALISIISLLQLRVFRITTIMLRARFARFVVVAFFKDWVFKYGILVSILSEDGPRFVSKVFQSVCRSLDISNVYTGTHYL